MEKKEVSKTRIEVGVSSTFKMIPFTYISKNGYWKLEKTHSRFYNILIID